MGNNCCGQRTYKANLTELEKREIQKRKNMRPSPANVINKGSAQGGIYLSDGVESLTHHTEKLNALTYYDES